MGTRVDYACTSLAKADVEVLNIGVYILGVGKMLKPIRREFFLTLSCIAKSCTNFKFDLINTLPRECGRVAISWILIASAAA